MSLVRRTPLAANAEKARAWRRRSRKPLPALSTRRRQEKPQRDAVRAQVLERDGGCTAARLVPHVACGGPLDCHEVIPRSAWAAGYLVESNTRMVCRRHHSWIGDHVADAHAAGLHGFSWERPAP